MNKNKIIAVDNWDLINNPALAELISKPFYYCGLWWKYNAYNDVFLVSTDDILYRKTTESENELINNYARTYSETDSIL